jgi:hypothetical protein
VLPRFEATSQVFFNQSSINHFKVSCIMGGMKMIHRKPVIEKTCMVSAQLKVYALI